MRLTEVGSYFRKLRRQNTVTEKKPSKLLQYNVTFQNFEF